MDDRSKVGKGRGRLEFPSLRIEVYPPTPSLLTISLTNTYRDVSSGMTLVPFRI